MALSLVLGPSVEPLSLQEAKDHLRVEIPDNDAYITALCQAARLYAEVYLAARGPLVASTFLLTVDHFPQRIRSHRWVQEGFFRLPRDPLISVQSITYLDQNGVPQLLDPSVYLVDAQSQPGRITLAFGQTWPDTYEVANAVTVQFVAGYLLPYTADAMANTLMVPGRVFALNDPLVLDARGGAAVPPPLQAGTVYYAISPSGNTCQVAATPSGTPIDLTGLGTGATFLVQRPPTAVLHAMKMLVSNWYENREPAPIGARLTQVIAPHAVDALLWSERLLEAA